MTRDFEIEVSQALGRIEGALEKLPCPSHSERMDRLDERIAFIQKTILVSCITIATGVVGYLAKLVVTALIHM